MFVVYFLIWTLMLYWIHRALHAFRPLRAFHNDHHRYIKRNKAKWHWTNLFLYSDTLKSTADLWTGEVIPTVLFCIYTGQWWILGIYYFWTALIQEHLEHNEKVKVPFFSFGRWHLAHHWNPKKNFGLFFPMWDIVFNTNKRIR